MPNYDAGTPNKSKRATRLYKDIDLDFGRNTVTNDVNSLTDVEAVKRSVRNLINTNHYERPFHPEIGSNLRAMLFENITPQMTHALSKQIDLLIKNFEPRCRLVQVRNLPDLDRNGYFVSINFYVQNHPTPVIVESFLERIR